ncbi:suppressor of cytokine signaling 1a [Dunckerocampus dactyliophorus]|uniref:suppressor of cytokine signaling 1a n=1 Tax=Dunckerocampus dactyliophorus TaxID=161453 RepID=UPI002406F795|nr:suppressor of cytokine signaling 1a [Dunckerocampus dactyliophorus]
MVANSAEDKHHLSSSSSSASPDPELLQHQEDAPNPKQKSASVTCKYRTHFPTFNCKEDCSIITDTASQLELSGFYWGPLGVEEAHRMLRDAPVGSYLIRDSRQKDVFFTLSYHAKSGPVSVRIDYKRQKFSLSGNERTFPTLFALLEHYINASKRRLKAPYRKWKPTLQELCRRRVMELCDGGGQVSELPLSNVLHDFLMEFPYKL